MQFRASSSARLLTTKVGLNECEEERLSELLSKIKLTKAEAERRDALEALRDKTEYTSADLSEGSKTYIEELVDSEIWQYENNVDLKEMQKGNMVEDESIELLNDLWFKQYKKSESKLEKEHWCGHPDIEDDEERIIIDMKNAWSKKTFPKTNEKALEKAKAAGYIDQVKCYLYMKGWSKGKVVYSLCDTPEELIPPYEDLSIHECGDLPLSLRVRWCDVELSQADIKKFEIVGRIASEYYEEYKQKQLNYV